MPLLLLPLLLLTSQMATLSLPQQTWAGRGYAAPTVMLMQLAKYSLLPLLLPTLLLLKPLLLLTSQMATLGLTQRLRVLAPAGHPSTLAPTGHPSTPAPTGHPSTPAPAAPAHLSCGHHG